MGPVAFVAAWAVSGATTGSYSPVRDAISDLAAVGAATRAPMTAGFVVYGLGLIAFGLALREALEGRAWIAAVATGSCTLAVAATPLGGWSGDTVHGIAAALGYAAIVVLPILASLPFASRGRRGWVLASRLTGITAALCLAATALGPAHGLWQRLGLTSADTWIVVTAVALASLRGPFVERAGRPTT